MHAYPQGRILMLVLWSSLALYHVKMNMEMNQGNQQIYNVVLNLKALFTCSSVSKQPDDLITTRLLA